MDYVDRMVDEFLKWRLPEDFAPDAGVVFTKPPNWHWWPTGTNLLTAAQARAMFETCAESLIEDLARKDADCMANGCRVTELEAELARVREELATERTLNGEDYEALKQDCDVLKEEKFALEFRIELAKKANGKLKEKLRMQRSLHREAWKEARERTERVARRAYDYGYREGQLQLARHENEAVAQAMREGGE